MTTPTTVNVQFQLRADTAANWTAANPTLLVNEFALETDTKKLKVGDGSTAWASLAYFPSIVTGGTVLGNLEIGSTGTLTFEGSTADGFETTLAVTDPTADRTITLPDQSGTVVVSGNASIVDADIAAGAEIAVSKLANGTANQVLVTDGTDVSWSNDLTLAGNLTVNGTTTTVNTQTLVVVDKNIELGVVDTPTDLTADGGGITLKGTTDKTINWVDSTDAWTSSERFSVPLGSAESPSLTFTGDENTGIYSPGADQLALSTSGVGRISINADGDVDIDSGGVFYDATNHRLAIGTTPVVDLDVAPAASTATFRIHARSNTTPVPAIELVRGTNTTFGADGYGDYRIKNDTGSLTFEYGDTGVTTERARIDSSGRLLVGTSSTSQQLSLLVQGSSGGGTSGVVRTAFTGATPAADAALGSFDFSDSGHTPAARIIARRDGGTWTSGTSQPTRLVFSTTANGASSPTERMRIDSAGRILIATTSTALSDEGVVIYTNGEINARRDTDGALYVFNRSGSTVGSITVSTTATAFNTSSDYRLKENIVPVTDGITRLQQLKPSRFNFIADPGKTVDGFIAHEVQAVVPEAITGEKDAVDHDGNPVYQGIDQSKLVPLLTAALQEAIGEIESLKARVAALEAN